MDGQVAKPLDHQALRLEYAKSLEKWADKIAGINRWCGNITNWHGPPCLVILDAQIHGLLDHEIVVCERITAKLAATKATRRVDVAEVVFRDLYTLLTNPGYAPIDPVARDDTPPYKKHVEVFRRLAEMIRAGGGAGSNDGRDAWMYQQKSGGRTHTQIRIDLAKRSEWDSLETDQSVGQAIDRYCDRHGLEKLRRKAAGRSEA